MSCVPRPRPPHLHRETTRHGKSVWYVRIEKGPRVRIRSEFGTPEFKSEYQAAITAQPRRIRGTRSGSLAWLVERYRETTAWTDLSPATRRQRENIFVHVLKLAGSEQFARITAASILAGRERRSDTPAQARNFLDAMRGVFRWAKKAQMVKVDPTADIKNPPRPKSDGFIPWTEEHVAAYERRWAVGSRQRVLAGRTALYRPSAWGRSVPGQATRPRWRRFHQNREDWHRGHASDPAGVGRDPCCRSLRRPRLHRRLKRKASDERVLRQRVSWSL